MMKKVDGYLQKWKKYRPLWKVDREGAIQKFASKNPDCNSYDEKMQFYFTMAAEVATYRDLQNVSFVQVCLLPLKTSVSEAAEAWVCDA